VIKCRCVCVYVCVTERKRERERGTWPWVRIRHLPCQRAITPTHPQTRNKQGNTHTLVSIGIAILVTSEMRTYTHRGREGGRERGRKRAREKESGRYGHIQTQTQTQRHRHRHRQRHTWERTTKDDERVASVTLRGNVYISDITSLPCAPVSAAWIHTCVYFMQIYGYMHV